MLFVAVAFVATIAILGGQTAVASNLDCSNGIIPTPSFGTNNAVFTVCSAICINAQAISIYNIVQNFDGYPDWNTFVKKVDKTSEGPYGLGSTMTFNNAMIFPIITYPSKELISVWNKAVTNDGFNELHVAWRYDTTTPDFLNAEHVTIVRDLNNGTSCVLSFETYYGPGALVVQLSTGHQLNQAFRRQNSDLKKFAEAGNAN